MKLFGNKRAPSRDRKPTDETGTLPTFASPEAMPEFDISGKSFDEELDLLLDGERLQSPAQLDVEPPKEMGRPINTDYHIRQDPIRGTTVHFDDDEEDTAQLSGWLKGTLLLIASMIILVLVVFGVYMNLT